MAAASIAAEACLRAVGAVVAGRTQAFSGATDTTPRALVDAIVAGCGVGCNRNRAIATGKSVGARALAVLADAVVRALAWADGLRKAVDAAEALGTLTLKAGLAIGAAHAMTPAIVKAVGVIARGSG
jgi:hypothetical protein